MRVCDPAEQRRGRAPVVVLLLLMLLAAACSDDGGPDPTSSASAPAPGEVPDLPRVTEGPAQAASVAANPTPVPAQPLPRPGDHVLVHLQGPPTAIEATDLVVRTEDGREIERFRLPQAVRVWAATGARQALVSMLQGGWARFDATTMALTLFSFDGAAPLPNATANHVVGPTVIFDEGPSRWLLRLDSGLTVDLAAELGEDVTVLEIGEDGEHALLQGGDVQLLTTATGDVRELPGAAAHALGGDGILSLGLPGAGGLRTLTTESVDGSGRRILAEVAGAVRPVALPGERVLLVGDESGIVEPDGSVTQVLGSGTIGLPVVVAADGSAVLATGGSGLVWVSLTPDPRPTPTATVATTASPAASPTAVPATVTARPLPDTANHMIVAEGGQSVFWASTTDPQQPGVVRIDPATGAVTHLERERPTIAVQSVTSDGSAITVGLGGDGPPVMLYRADGSSTPLLDGVSGASVLLHPGGEIAALSQGEGTTRSLLVGRIDGRVVEVDDGRMPVWLRTT